MELARTYFFSMLVWSTFFIAVLGLIPSVRAFFSPTSVLIFAVSLALAQLAGDASLILSGGPELYGALARALLLAVLVGAPIGVALEVYPLCGRCIDLGRGVSLGGQLNPGIGGESSPLEFMMRFLSLGVFLSAAGIGLVFELLTAEATSFLNSGGDIFRFSAALELVQLFGRSLLISVLLAAPVLVSALIFDVTTGVVSRSLGRINLSFELLPLKLIAGLLVAILILGSLPSGAEILPAGLTLPVTPSGD